jgi:2,3-bisphosphoglycerate-independent phosphoglycerate mutase
VTKSLHRPQPHVLQAYEGPGSNPLPPAVNLPRFRLGKIGDKRYHPYYDKPDAHQIVEDFGENHYHDAEDKRDDSPNEAYPRYCFKKTKHRLSPPLIGLITVLYENVYFVNRCVHPLLSNGLCVGSVGIDLNLAMPPSKIAVTMIGFEQMKKLSRMSPSKIVLLVLDGLGGLPDTKTGKTELESAKKPNLNRIARDSICGLIDPVGPGITPGSAPGHLAIFGYDPIEYQIGRGVMEALGIDVKLKPEDIAARGNFCTVDDKGVITDRRAGRVSTDISTELCRLLDNIAINGAETSVLSVREHRFVLILRGEGLLPELADSDPQQPGLAPKRIEALSPRAHRTAEIANEFVTQSRNLLQGKTPANMVLLRGFSRCPDVPPLTEIYKLRPAAISIYPMYRGLARLVGMQILPSGESITEQLDNLRRYYTDYDFFFIHFKSTDARGEDGNFQAKVQAIEELDNALSGLVSLNPDVLIITGDHSTPATLAMHSWHPVPFLLKSKWCRPDDVAEFSERACLTGAMGRFPATEIMPLAMANALKLDKFGA